MMDESRKELEKLEKQLLADETWFARELDSAKRMIGENPVNKTANPAAPRASVAWSAPARPAMPGVSAATTRLPGLKKEPALEEYEPPKKGIRGLVILAALETLGIVGVVAYWMLFLL